MYTIIAVHEMLKGQAARREKALCDNTARPVGIIGNTCTSYTTIKRKLHNY